jgi:hypothetical protein
MTPTTHLSSILTFFVCVACGGATAIDPDDGSGSTSGNGGTAGSGSGSGTGSQAAGGTGGKTAGGVTGAGGKVTGGVTGAGGKATGGGAGGKATGGASNLTRWAKEYDQSCKFDGDCVAVTEGPVCTCNACFNAGINRNEYERWGSSVAGPCGPIACDPIGCLDMVPVCYGGLCGVRAVDYIQPGQFDRDCSLQSECSLVPVGDLCSGCNCEFDAVSAKGLEQYRARIKMSQSSCGSPGIECGCAAPQAVCRLDGSRSQCAAIY